MTTILEAPISLPDTVPGGPSHWSGRPRSLGSRIGLTYVAVAAGGILAAGLGLPLAVVAASLGEGWDGLGYAVLVLLAAALLGAVVAVTVAVRMGLGWATAVLLPAVLVPILLAAWADAALVGLLMTPVWPVLVAVLVGARQGAGVRAAVVAGALSVTLAGSLALAWAGETRRVEARAQDLTETGRPVLAPAEVSGTDWGFVMGFRDSITYTFTDADGYTNRVEIVSRDEAPEETVGRPDGALLRVRSGRASARVHGEAVALVSTQAPGSDVGTGFSPERSDATARSLVERSPEWLAARPERLHAVVDR